MTEAEAVARSEGSTPSERYLAKLCDRSFLKLWSYPNVYIDKRKNGKGDGKELCDLLVVCGDHVLIFSDKTIGWQGGEDLLLSWKRWFNRAIHHSARQIRKAERWIDQMPDKIYLDKGCTKPFPFKLPPRDRRKVHGIIVALGAGQACKEFFNEGLGSLMLVPEIRGDEHLKGDGIIPFTIGDVDPNGPFIHVLDDATLDIVMRELDTVTDFTSYLSKKAEFFRSGRLLTAGGEEELVAYYMVHMNADGEHDFTAPDGKAIAENTVVGIASGHYATLQSDRQYLAKKEADRHSYVWDRLIEKFTDHMRAGTTIVPDGQTSTLSDWEQGVRYMALAPRFTRRMYGKSIREVFEKGRYQPRFTRWFMPGEFSPDRESAFFFMTLAVPERELPGGYEQYRSARRRIMETQSLALLLKYPALRRVIGIATEPAAGKGSSEDIILVEDIVWTSELIEKVERQKRLYNIMENMSEQPVDESEFPTVDDEAKPPPSRYPGGPGMNRNQRRAMKAERRRRR